MTNDNAQISGICVLCGSSDVLLHWRGFGRDYLRCCRCGLVFVPRSMMLDDVKQKERYDLHVNDESDAGYVAFLRILADAVKPYIKPGAKGLDFGCGKVPVLSSIIRRAGVEMDEYDKFYFPDGSFINRKYDIILCSETAEHMEAPSDDFARMAGVLNRGGVIAVMTGMYDGISDFGRWHYVNDMTHINFFCESAFKRLAFDSGLDLIRCGGNVAVMTKGVNTHV